MIKLFPLNSVRSLQLFQLFRFASFFLVGIYFAKSNLDLKEIGIYETLMLLAGAVSYFWVSGLLNSYLAKYPNLSSSEKESSHFNVFLALTLISIAIGGALILFQDGVINLLTEKGKLPFYQLIVVYILFNNPSYITEHILLLHQKSNAILAYGLATFIGNVIALCLPIYLNYSLEDAILWLAAFAGLKFVFALIITSSYSSYKINKRLVIKLLSLSTPLILSFVITGSAQYIDGYLVSKFFGESDLAIFRYGARELPFSLLLANALSLAMVPQLALKDSLGAALKKLKSESKMLILFLFPISIVLMLSSHWFFPIIFNENFAESAGIFNVYLLLIISRMAFPQSILIAKNENKLLLTISVIELITNILISVILMLELGIIGIAYGTVIAFLMEKTILLFVVKKKWKIKSAK
ncbi:MAG: oligosaccharide flippase family protein, partial [Bacteroidia bacterium]|nr:oligosaccharide flippase family protein [Bacteroidia bacterium]